MDSKGNSQFKETEIGRLPIDWNLISLKEVCSKIGSGITPRGGTKVYTSKGKALIRSQNVMNNHFSPEGLVYLGEDTAEEMKNVAVEEHDILLNITGDSVARCCTVPDDVLPARVNQHVSIIRTNGKELDSIFLKYYLTSPKMQNQMLSLAQSGGTRNALTKAMIENFIIPKPNMTEQKAIAYVFSILDSKIEINQRMNRALEAIGEAVFKRWFVDFEFPNQEGKPYKSSGGEMTESDQGQIPKGWEIKRYEEITEAIFSGGTPDTRNNEYWNGDYSWLSSGETSDHFILKTEKKITKKGIENSSTRLAKKGDIVIASAGQGKTRGQAALCLIDTYVNQSVNVVHSKNSIVPNSYLFLNLSLRYPQLRAISDSFSIRGSLTTKLLKDLEILMPPLRITGAFNDWFNLSSRKIQSNLVENEVLSQIRDLLLPKLFSGKIRVPVTKEKVESVGYA